MNDFFTSNNFQGVLAKRLLLTILLFSFFATLAVSSYILYSDYLEQLESQDASLTQLKNGYLKSLSQSAWHFNSDQIESQLQGIISFPNIIYASVKTQYTQQHIGSDIDNTLARTVVYNLTHIEDGKSLKIGKLTVIISREKILISLTNKGIRIIITQFIKTFVVSIFILFIINSMVTRHLNTMANWARKMDMSTPLTLHRTTVSQDEISDVSDAINSMRLAQTNTINEIIEIKEELEIVNQELEDRVSKRTRDLLKTVYELRSAQKKLVESEKMASLGQLVAGMAHELNTPLGVCVTAQSHLNQMVESIEKKSREGTLTKLEFKNSMRNIIDSVSLLDTNLSRSKNLITSFKKLAVSPKEQVASKFSLVHLVEELEIKMGLTLENNNVKIKLLYAEDIEVQSYAEPLKLVLEQLIKNSLEYGLPNRSGNIYICAIEGENCLNIDFRDDGIGIPESIKDNIFEPFVTTGRFKGKPGLGLHIVYNLVTQILNGSIMLIDSKMGAHFNINISKNINNSRSIIDIIDASKRLI